MIQKVAVIGAGTMGQGIAQWFSQVGTQVQLFDVSIEQSSRAIENIYLSWDKLQSKNKFSKEQVVSFKENISIVESIEDFQKDTTLVIEAIIEKLEIKVDLFQKLDSHFSETTFFSSNTSSIPIDAMAKELSRTRREKFFGLHFFNPATIMKLVEIIDGHWTNHSITDQLTTWFNKNGKKPARCIDGPGFIVNRLARNFYGEPFRIIKTENHDSIKEADSILKEVGGFRMGPFELMDLIGIDINYAVSESVWQSFYHNERFTPHPLQKKMVTSGRLGRKTKGGFYSYE